MVNSYSGVSFMIDNPNFRTQEWRRVRTLWPKMCSYTGRNITMGSVCYHLYETRNTVDKEGMVETSIWVHDKEFAFLRLKGVI